MSKIPDRRTAAEGEPWFLKTLSFEDSGIVKAKSPGTRGQWVCISCGVPLEHNFEKDIHCDGPRPRARGMELRPGGSKAEGEQARHVLAWRSFDSGNVEVP